jgi:formate-dependent nitrite reductase membrane component NrfD
LHIPILTKTVFILSAAAAVLVAIYTAFLFAQAKGRDFWQSPLLPFHMLLHSLMAGAAFFLLTSPIGFAGNWTHLMAKALPFLLAGNVLIMLAELFVTHPTEDAKTVAHMILKGRYKNKFWLGGILFGNLLPAALLFVNHDLAIAAAGLITLTGIYITEHIWVEAPQRIQLT